MNENIAVLIDFENIAAGTEKDGMGRFDVEKVLQRVKDKGRILISRSYADWGRFARFKQTLLSNNVTMMELTSHGMQDKNRADIALVVDALELAFTRDYIDTFVVVSGDSDFTPLVLKMRELNKRVIGCGCRSSTSRLLVQACDEFIYYDNIVKGGRRPRSQKQDRKPASGTSSQAATLDAAFDLLAEALEGLQREIPDPPLASVVKNAMQRKDAAFSESDVGFSSFGRFLEKAQKEGIVSLMREQKSGGYRVDTPDGDQTGTDDNTDSNDSNTRSGDFDDPYLPEGTESWVQVLDADGLNPLSAPLRKAVLDALEEAVAYRKKRKRRISVQFVQEDVRKKLNKTHPGLPTKAIRAVFNGLMRTGSFIHRDGNPVRTMSAPFNLEKDAEQLNQTLADIYLDVLHQSGANLDDVQLLAELFHGNSDQTRQIEEALAYQQAHAQEDFPVDDLDSLLDVEPNDSPPSDAVPSDQATAADLDADSPTDDKASASADQAGASVEQPPSSQSEDADGKDAKKTAAKAAPKRRTRSKKASSDGTSTQADPTKASSDSAEKPKRKPKRKPAKTAEPSPEGASDAQNALDTALQVED